jgi:hypothetical protein
MEVFEVFRGYEVMRFFGDSREKEREDSRSLEEEFLESCEVLVWWKIGERKKGVFVLVYVICCLNL